MPEAPDIDVRELIGEVAKRHGITLREDDPAFALVTMNRLVLQRYLDLGARRISAALGDFEQAAMRVQEDAGSKLGLELRTATAALRSELQKERLPAVGDAGTFLAGTGRVLVIVGLVCGVILFAAGLMFGLYLRKGG